jgi:hypothetical protein
VWSVIVPALRTAEQLEPRPSNDIKKGKSSNPSSKWSRVVPDKGKTAATGVGFLALTMNSLSVMTQYLFFCVCDRREKSQRGPRTREGEEERERERGGEAEKEGRGGEVWAYTHLFLHRLGSFLLRLRRNPRLSAPCRMYARSLREISVHSSSLSLPEWSPGSNERGRCRHDL